MSSSTSTNKSHEIGERVAVLETEVGHVKDAVAEVKKNVNDGFRAIGEKIDKIKVKACADEVVAEEKRSDKKLEVFKASEKERSTSFFGMNIPGGKQGMIWFILGVGFILFMLMSNFPGLGKFLSMVSSGDDKSFVECKESESGKMECEGDLSKLIEMVNGSGGSDVNSNKSSRMETAKSGSGAIVLPEEKFEVEDEGEVSEEDKDEMK